MRSFIAALRKYQLLQAFVYIVLGIFLLINPDSFFKIMIYLLGGYFIVMGLLGLISEIRTKMPNRSSVVLQVLLMLTGVLVIIFLPTLIGLMNVIFGLFIFAHGIGKIFDGLNLRKEVINTGRSIILYGALLAILGLVILFNPFATTLFLFQITGLILIITGLIDLVSYFGLRKYF
ncbi:HdeD family acid-resistance protein [Enterococcus timonensis]|uniref:HdeD family acid-resistance protein n=1 Tax=Enterococcus timonensis TaxID=1852364 RepID=UPI0008DA4FCD|nr:DUF308 domain-containing protein [Enterococcus timonensis]